MLFVQVKSTGQVLLMEVVHKLNLLEYDYFDLQFFDIHGTPVSKFFLDTSFWYDSDSVTLTTSGLISGLLDLSKKRNYMF